jgi:hypothetical protein
MFKNTACRLTKHSWICTKILSRNLLLLYCNVVIRNLKIMPLIWKYCYEHNNVSHNVNIICTKTIVPDYNAYKSNCRTKVGCTLDKIHILESCESASPTRFFCVMNLRSPWSLILAPAMKQNIMKYKYTMTDKHLQLVSSVFK